MERAGPASAAFEAGLPPPEEANSPAAARSALGSSGTPPPEFPRRISFEAKMAMANEKEVAQDAVYVKSQAWLI